VILVFVTIIFLLLYGTIILAYSYGWKKASGSLPRKKGNVEEIFISVIVPARNEEDNMEACIRSLLEQRYPAHLFEIIVVDDASTDRTAAIVNSILQKNNQVRLISLKPQYANAHKKHAINAGIDAAKGTVMACTDADCTHHPNWLPSLASTFYDPEVQFVAAPVCYHTNSSFLSVFQTLDFMTLQGITAASVAMHWHNMCNGANIAYRKEAFERVGGFMGIDHLPTGDDMMLMHKIALAFPNGTAYLRSRNAMVNTYPVASWEGFFQQRIRWASKAAYYEDRRIFGVLLLVYFFNLWMLLLALFSIWRSDALILFLISLAFKTVIELIFLFPVASFYNKRKWLWWFPFMQPFHIMYTLIAGWFGRFTSYQWKGRVIDKPSTLVKS
jgi:cellulose synthase/poly-beta-1,6-N-acetylglucosamine synthase-like glycosyltransferase